MDNWIQNELMKPLWRRWPWTHFQAQTIIPSPPPLGSGTRRGPGWSEGNTRHSRTMPSQPPDTTHGPLAARALTGASESVSQTRLPGKPVPKAIHSGAKASRTKHRHRGNEGPWNPSGVVRFEANNKPRNVAVVWYNGLDGPSHGQNQVRMCWLPPRRSDGRADDGRHGLVSAGLVPRATHAGARSPQLYLEPDGGS